jgi:hypothetical protein|tara:strand:+ start:497 stop:874 length:378 start_codon:yes stop_codon:yes gene_type:complete
MILLNQDDKRYKIDNTQPVKIYRNLHKGCWSVKQNGLVKAHSDEINLYNCEFLVNENNRQKVIKEKRKNVHAFVKGYIWTGANQNLDRRVCYNPYFKDCFYDIVLENKIDKAHFVRAVDGKLFYN